MIGTDIVEIKRFRKIKNLDRLAQRILTPSEQEMVKAKDKAKFIAKRFCIKEAISKAFGTGIGGKLSFQDIEVFNMNSGRPAIRLFRKVRDDIRVSVTDTEEIIMSQVIITRY